MQIDKQNPLKPHIPYVELKPERPTSFHIRPLRRTVDPIALKEGPHRHNFQELLWVKTGSGWHKIDHTVLEIKPRTFYLIAQGQVHYFIKGIELEGYLIRFTDDFLLDNSNDSDWNYRVTLFSHFAIHQSLTIEKEEIALFEQVVERMWQEHQTTAFGQTDVLGHLLNILLIQLERTRRKTVQQQKPLTEHAHIYQAFITLLEQDYKQQHQVSHYANTLHVSPRQLSDIVRRFSGKTGKQLIQERLMLEAKRYLQHTNASVKEIAYTLGYNDPSYFSKVFKQIAGIAPHAYKGNTEA